MERRCSFRSLGGEAVMKKLKFFTLAASLLVFGMVACEDTDLRAVSGIESVVMESSSSTISLLPALLSSP